MRALQRFDEMCSSDPAMRSCESEDSKVIGPVKMNWNSSIHQQPLFYFAFDGPLESESVEFHRGMSAGKALNSFVYMLDLRKHLSIREIEGLL